ncbi:MAG: aminotransferase class I/II-fold pyridoxal phosphate-dependent enzyme [Acidiferrobacterales bacterium]|nr:aminotransferase class I/II-fold pyridoxal phosphate-dependent enzyme [Acidiferrobacterales bacterium]
MNDYKTLLAQAGHYIDGQSGGIVPPIMPSVTFARDENLELIGDYVYSRYDNPTYTQLERIVCKLEGGEAALFFASGLAAIAAVFETVDMGQHIVAPRVMYHGTVDWLKRISEKRSLGLTLFHPSDPDGLSAALQPGKTAIVWIESPINPSWEVLDIRRAADEAHAAGAILAVDCTAAPPVTTCALELGADIVFHSATKYLNGHSDLNAGVLVTRRKTPRWDDIIEVRKLTGGLLGTFEAWLLLRGMRTLSIRYERASDNAMKIARFLESHDAVDQVLYPGLPSHPTYDIACRQMSNGYGGMMSILMRGGAEAARKFVSSVNVFVRATSLGGVESLIEHRRTVEGRHSQVPVNLIRLSVGIEDVDELIADLDQALSGL